MSVLIFDGHLDLAMNALAYDREQTLSIAALRQREAEIATQDGRGTAAVTLPEMMRGGVRLCVATLFARSAPGAKVADALRRSGSDGASPAIAHATAAGQLAYYRLLEKQGYLQIITQGGDLGSFAAGLVLPASSSPLSSTIGCIVLMECADPITEPAQVEWWWQQGVRAVSLAHTQPTMYAHGNAADGPLTAAGHDLLARMQELGMALDTSHLADRSIAQALDAFGGPVFASHSNCRALVPGMRQLTDAQIRQIIQRGGVVGAVLHNPMIAPGLQRQAYNRAAVTLERLAEHIDHICQLAGSVIHVGIGSDLDGGFGNEYAPVGIDSIADLAKIGEALSARRYRDADVAAVLHGNWLRFWKDALTQSAPPAPAGT